MKEYKLEIKNFNGPLDVLLELVKDKKMDIFDIDLAELATAYLGLIKQLKDNDIELAGEYLVMAASLIQLKSKIILQDPAKEKEIEEDRNALLKRLAEYQQFKNMISTFKEHEELRHDIFIKESEDLKDFQKPVDETKLTGKSDPVKLIMTLRKMFERTHANQMRQTTLEAFNMSPEDRAVEIKELFKDKDEITFKEVFTVPTLKHFAITLLALLDMSRLQVINLVQDKQFDTIKITKGVLYEQ